MNSRELRSVVRVAPDDRGGAWIAIGVLVCTSLVFAGCKSVFLANHTDASDRTTTDSASDVADAGPQPDRVGATCRTGADCQSGICGPDGRCTHRCANSATDCPPGWTCSTTGAGVSFCTCRPSGEICDALDNDCDGLVDNGSLDCRQGFECVDARCVCSPGRTACGTSPCVDIQSDDQHCGNCSNVCPSERHCMNGQCACGNSAVDCYGRCVHLDSDPRNCGACGHICQSNACDHSTCVCPPTASTNCGGRCVDLQQDYTNCGRCGLSCPSGLFCNRGECGCPASRATSCGGRCVDTSSDRGNCGTCGHACATDRRCESGRCVCDTYTPIDCGGLCADLRGDVLHCGTCDNHCPTGASCSEGRCLCPIETPSICNDTCVDLQRNVVHCGACGHACESACEHGTCVTIRDIAVGGSICVLMNDGTVRCQSCGWGCSSLTDFSPNAGLTDVEQLAVGDRFACARLTDGSVQCWGENDRGQLGDGAAEPARSTPAPVMGLSGVVQISAGIGYACARTDDGGIYCWGDNSSGQIGDGTTTRRNLPVRIALPGNATDVDAGYDHTCAIVGGTVHCWGGNARGQVGGGSPTQLTPIPVDLDAPAVQVSTGIQMTCAIGAGGPLWCWGRAPVPASNPHPVPLPVSIDEVRAGRNLFVRLRDGRVFVWAFEPGSDLGAGAPIPGAAMPLRVGTLVGIRRIDTYAQGCALDAVGAFWCWGDSPARLSP